jgi:hypothetical protein
MRNLVLCTSYFVSRPLANSSPQGEIVLGFLPPKQNLEPGDRRVPRFPYEVAM